MLATSQETNLPSRRGIFCFTMILTGCFMMFTQEPDQFLRHRKLQAVEGVPEAVPEHMSAARKYRSLNTLEEVQMMQCDKPVTTYDSAPPQADEKFNCNYQHTITKVNSCGEVNIPAESHPWVSECHLKDRLFSRITRHQLNQCAFGALDLGANNGGWVLGVGSFAPKSRYAAVEATPAIYQRMLQNFATNEGLAERVYGYNVAAGSSNAYASHTGPLFDANNAWTGPSMCVPREANEAVGQTASKGANCPQQEVSVPIITPDSILEDFSPMIKGGPGLFFAKLDIEGGEYEALMGMRSVFTDPERRPCYVYVDLKTSPDSEKAVRLLQHEFGYSNFMDLDSGLIGNDSYPPKGSRSQDTGNYEFWLNESDILACAERVQQASCDA